MPVQLNQKNKPRKGGISSWKARGNRTTLSSQFNTDKTVHYRIYLPFDLLCRSDSTAQRLPEHILLLSYTNLHATCSSMLILANNANDNNGCIHLGFPTSNRKSVYLNETSFQAPKFWPPKWNAPQKHCFWPSLIPVLFSIFKLYTFHVIFYSFLTFEKMWRSKDRTGPPNTTYRWALSKFLACISLGDVIWDTWQVLFLTSQKAISCQYQKISFQIALCYCSPIFFLLFSLMNENYRRHIFERDQRIRDLSSLFPRTVQLNTTTTRRSRAQLFGSSLTTKPMGANWVEKQPVKEKKKKKKFAEYIKKWLKLLMSWNSFKTFFKTINHKKHASSIA